MHDEAGSRGGTRQYDVVADALLRARVECVFGVMGEDTAPLVVAIAARGIRYLPARHENQAVAMADGYARATGRLGVATVTGGPGVSNALTAIHTAHRASSPVLVIAGAGRPTEDDLAPGVIREGNAASTMKHLPHAALLGGIGIQVFKPLVGAAVVRETERALAHARSATGVLVLGRMLLLETAAIAAPTHAPVEAVRPCAPDPELVNGVADLLQETWAVKRPLILAGRGALRAGAVPALARLGEITGAIVATTLPARESFHEQPYYVGVCGTYSTPVASELIAQSDCVLAFGAGLNKLTTYDNTMFRRALIVHIDATESAIGRFVDVELGIVADARLTAEALVAVLEARGHRFAGFRTRETAEAIARFDAGADVKEKSVPGAVDPRCLMLALDRMLPRSRVLCADGGQQPKFAIRYIGVERPENFLYTIDAGSIGLSLGVAIGAAVARPDSCVVAAMGDGAMMMSLADLETAVRLKLPMLVVVANDEAYGAEVCVLADLGMQTDLARIPCPSFAAMAEAMGAQAATVRTLADLTVVESWLRGPHDRPLVLDCRVNDAVRAM
jgi:thiamine pyrophosphate-dependent acetolactate synthase large subunit-like protein